MIKEIVKNLSLSSTLKINEISKDLEAQGKIYLNLVLVSLHLKHQKK